MYIDLNWEVKTNAEFLYRLQSIYKEVERMERKADGDPHTSDKIAEKILDIYRLCKYNAGLLLPYFFPAYPYDKPLSCTARPYAYAMFHMQIGGFMAFRAGRQIGKALEENEPCLTPEGWVSIGNIKVGDTVYDADGSPTQVTGVYPQGVRPTYKMTFTDGSHSVCDEEHLWLCKKGGKSRNFSVRSLKQIRARKGGDNPTSDQGIRIPLTRPIQLPEVEHYIKPYTLGLLLGDGCLSKTGTMGFTSADPELGEYLNTQDGIRATLGNNYQYRLSNSEEHAYKHNSKFRQELTRLDLRHTAELKHIPAEYIYDSVENRLELLRGLMDTDGTIYGKCQVEYYSTSRTLAEQVQFIVQSLGGKATIKEKQGYYKKMGLRVDCKLCYRVMIKIQDVNPFRLKRKADRFYNIRYERTRVLKKVEYTGDANTVCITVASPTKTFITRDCIVTHNSSSFAARQLINAHIIPKHRSMYIVPHQSYLDTYANRLREMERAFKFYSPHKDFRQNLKYKEYPNGSVTMLVKCLTDTQEARSKTCAEALFDEAQFLDPDFLPDIEQCQKASNMPSTIYAGTSTTMETLLETKFLSSSQASWLIRAPGYESGSAGKGWINCGDKDDVLKCIKPQGFTHPVTNKVLDVTDGHFVHQEMDRFEQGYLGFHIPQIIIPDYANKPEKWMEVWNAYETYDIKKFLQEILGIPTEEGMREITLKDLKAICVLAETPETLKEIACATNGRYKYTISGCDWGGSDYNPASKTKVSFTVHAVLGVTWDGQMDILHMRQYSGMDYRSIANDICQVHKEYGCIGIASDYGVGAAYNMLLRENPAIQPERHLIFGYVGPQSAVIKATTDSSLMNHFSLNRTESITTLYQAVRDRRLRCYHWGLAQDRLLEFLNLFRVPTEGGHGQNTFKYQRHGAKADDTLHAVNFAYCLGRIIMNEPIVEDQALRRMFQTTFTPGHYAPQINPYARSGMDMGGVISG